jgi:uncharacterized protein (DUF1501 family)
LNRKDFIQLSTASGLSFGLGLGQSACSRSEGLPKWKGKRLVLVQLVGGHDGLFAYAPEGIDVLEKKRPSLNGILVENGISVSNGWLLNGMLSGLMPLLDSGELVMIPGVGYENPNRSHFKAQEFWETGEVIEGESNNLRGTGWLGRFWEAELRSKRGLEFPFVNLHSSRTLYDKGRDTRAYNVTGLEALKWYESFISDFFHDLETSEFLAVERLMKEEIQNQWQQLQWFESFDSFREYTNSTLTQQLQRAADIIKADLPFTAIHTQLGGFDTHAGQPWRLSQLYSDFLGGMQYLSKQLKNSGHWKDTLVFVYSDFGRTIDENRSGGTDHGYSGLCMVAGGNLSMFSQYCKPQELKFTESRGELFLDYTTDFRDLLGQVSRFLV